MKTISIRLYFNYVLICTEIWLLTNGLLMLLFPGYGITICASLILGSFIGGLSFAFTHSRFYQNKPRFYLALFIIIASFSALAVFLLGSYNGYQRGFPDTSHISIWSNRLFLIFAMKFRYTALAASLGSIVPNIIWCLTLLILNNKENKIPHCFFICFSLLLFFIILFLIIIYCRYT